MKFFTFLLSLMLFFSAFCFYSPSSFASANYESYFRINNDAILYKTPNSSHDLENLYFELTPTYFVKYIDTVGNFYKVYYNGVIGYVPQKDVTKVYGTPKTPFPEDITFKINSSVSAVIRSSPSVEGNFLGLLPCDTEITYIGKISGKEAIESLGNLWYYVSYTSFEQGILSGYIYAPLTENLTPIKPNTEELSTTSVNTDPSDIISPELTNPNNLLLIGGLTLGGIVLVLILFVPIFKSKKDNLVSQQKQLPYKEQDKIDNNDFDF